MVKEVELAVGTIALTLAGYFLTAGWPPEMIYRSRAFLSVAFVLAVWGLAFFLLGCCRYVAEHHISRMVLKAWDKRINLKRIVYGLLITLGICFVWPVVFKGSRKENEAKTELNCKASSGCSQSQSVGQTAGVINNTGPVINNLAAPAAPVLPTYPCKNSDIMVSNNLVDRLYNSNAIVLNGYFNPCIINNTITRAYGSAAGITANREGVPTNPLGGSPHPQVRLTPP